ncbi:MAG TPA: hypothetical protein VHU41_14340 [Thermoanaerobaculia bacterium]|jgi:hypothetical protein|nr:hypothetical protein [Thermoanaerobaculia bacterium]
MSPARAAAACGTDDCGALTQEEALATGLTLDELRSRSFVKIMKGRREHRPV